METYKNLKKSTKIGLIVSAVLLLAVLVGNAITVVQSIADKLPTPTVFSAIGVVMCVIIMLYAFFGYKKPHGNLLKFAFLAFAVYLALQGMNEIAGRNRILVGGLCVFTGLIIAYMAGRLHKIEKNKIALIVVGVLLLAKTVIVFATSHVVFEFLVIVGRITPMILLTTLGFAYVARFEEHRAAGLADKADA